MLQLLERLPYGKLVALSIAVNLVLKLPELIHVFQDLTSLRVFKRDLNYIKRRLY